MCCSTKTCRLPTAVDPMSSSTVSSHQVRKIYLRVVPRHNPEQACTPLKTPVDTPRGADEQQVVHRFPLFKYTMNDECAFHELQKRCHRQLQDTNGVSCPQTKAIPRNFSVYKPIHRMTAKNRMRETAQCSLWLRHFSRHKCGLHVL